MTDTITINGYTFKVSRPYLPGHVCTAAEADVLNRKMHSNLRRIFSVQVQDAEAKVGPNHVNVGSLQIELNKLSSTYSFERSDPIRAEAFAIALEVVRAAIKKEGKRIGDYSKAALSSEAEKILSGTGGHSILELARARVAQVQRLAQEELAKLEA